MKDFFLNFNKQVINEWSALLRIVHFAIIINMNGK